MQFLSTRERREADLPTRHLLLIVGYFGYFVHVIRIEEERGTYGLQNWRIGGVTEQASKLEQPNSNQRNSSL